MIRGAAVFGAATVLLLFSKAIPWQPLFQAALGLYALLALCLMWIASSLWGVRFTRLSPVRRSQVGQDLRDAFELANASALPKLGLEIRDHSTLPGHNANSLVSLAPRRREAGLVQTVNEIRGLYTLGPTGAAATDPFGLFHIEWRIGPPTDVLVYPETVDLDHFAVPGTIITEGARIRRRTQQQTTDPSGTRPYVYGDSVRRIHWLSSAHTGQLMVKEFEFTPAADVWIFLDLEEKVQAGTGVHSTEEYAVTTAASVAAHYLKAGRAVGLVASDRQREIVPADRGERQLIRLLETLAIVRANGRTPFSEVLWADRARLSRTSTAVAISASMDEAWAGVLAQVVHLGTPAAALLIEASTFGAPAAATMQVAALSSAGVPVYLIKRSGTIRDAIQEGLPVSRGQ